MKTKVKRFSVRNAGVLDEASIELGDITLIFGRNNTGKTALVNNLRRAFDVALLPMPPELMKAMEAIQRLGIFGEIGRYIDPSGGEFGLQSDVQEVQFDESELQGFRKLVDDLESGLKCATPRVIDAEKILSDIRRCRDGLSAEEIKHNLIERVSGRLKHKSFAYWNMMRDTSCCEECELELDFCLDDISEPHSTDKLKTFLDAVSNANSHVGVDLRSYMDSLDYMLFVLMPSVRKFDDSRGASINDSFRRASEFLGRVKSFVSQVNGGVDDECVIPHDETTTTGGATSDTPSFPSYDSNKKSIFTEEGSTNGHVFDLLLKITGGDYIVRGENCFFRPLDFDDARLPHGIEMRSSSGSARAMFAIYEYPQLWLIDYYEIPIAGLAFDVFVDRKHSSG